MPRIDIVGQEFANFGRAVEAFADNHGGICSTDVEHGASGAALRPNVVEAWKSHTRNKGVTRAAYHIGGQLIGHGNFVLGSFAQTNANGIANTVSEKCANTCCTLDAAVLTFACLCHAEMKWEIHPLRLHDGAQKAHTAHHDHCVGRFDGDDNILEVFFLTNAQKLHAALHDALGRISVARHNTVAQRPVVYAYADGCVVGAADVE